MLKKNRELCNTDSHHLRSHNQNQSSNEQQHADLYKTDQSCGNLIHELYDLLSDEQVRQNMDDNLRDRIQRIINHAESMYDYENLADSIQQIKEQQKKNKFQKQWQIQDYMQGSDAKNSKTTTAHQTQLINNRKQKQPVVSQNCSLFFKKTNQNQNKHHPHSNHPHPHKSQIRTKIDSTNKQNNLLKNNSSLGNLKKNKFMAYKIKQKNEDSHKLKKQGSKQKSLGKSKSNLKLMTRTNLQQTRSNATSKGKNSKSNSKIQSPYHRQKSNIVPHQQTKISRSQSHKNYKRSPVIQLNQLQQPLNYTLSRNKTKKRQKFYTEEGPQTNPFNTVEQLNNNKKRVNTQIYQQIPNFQQQQQQQQQQDSHSQLPAPQACQQQNPTNTMALKMLTVIYQKQQQILHQKTELQQKVSTLKEKIAEQKQLLEQRTQNINSIYLQLQKNQANCQLIKGKKIESHKKLEEVWSQVKKINRVLEGMKSQNQEVNDNINEEGQLIVMYKTVIEELKIQLKIQKNKRDQIKKELHVTRKSKEAQKIKSNNAHIKTGDMINSVMKSMEKWM